MRLLDRKTWKKGANPGNSKSLPVLQPGKNGLAGRQDSPAAKGAILDADDEGPAGRDLQPLWGGWAASVAAGKQGAIRECDEQQGMPDRRRSAWPATEPSKFGPPKSGGRGLQRIEALAAIGRSARSIGGPTCPECPPK